MGNFLEMLRMRHFASEIVEEKFSLKSQHPFEITLWKMAFLLEFADGYFMDA